MPEIKLKTCPFCGRKVETSVITCCTGAKDCILFCVYCSDCHIGQYININNYDNFEKAEKAMYKAVEAWNKRAKNETD